MLALFVAPVLLDAAYDTSVRDLRANWIPITCLVLAAVGITTFAVAWTVHALVPGMPWAAAIALGAIVAPPDAAAASAILKQLRLPHRLLVILQGESLLNDASALLIYRIAVLAVVSGGLDFGTVVPMSLLSIVGSVVAGYLLARLYMRLTVGVTDVPSSIVLQFAGTFGVWILAEHLHLSAIVTVVVYGITMARDAPRLVPARNRLPSYAVWDLVVFVLNVLAFVLIGLQLRPILGPLAPQQRLEYFQVAAIVLGIVRRRSIRVGVQLCGGRAAETALGRRGRMAGHGKAHCARFARRELVRHARHRHARCSVRVAERLSESRSHSADGILRRRRDAGVARPDAATADSSAEAAGRRSGQS